MRPLTHHHRFGFTLLELMIAVSLGMLIIYSAAAGLRTVTQSISVTNKLATENALLRSSMAMALEEVDYWSFTDDPDDTNKQPLRATNAGAGLPFRSFDNAIDPIIGGPFLDKKFALDENPLNARGGWNPNPLAWAAWDPRTWSRSNIPETHNLGDHAGHKQYWGTFGIYENLSPSKSWHHWYGGQVLGLMDALGFWGLYEYMPSNTFFMYHTDMVSQVPKNCKTGGLSWGGCPKALLQNDDWWGNSDGSDNTMKGRVRNSNGANYFMPSPNSPTSAAARKIAKIGYEGRDVGYDANKIIPQFLTECGPTEMLLQSHPEHWSNVSFSVHRFMARAQFITVCTVRSEHALTGETMAFSFSVIGTTLRGARQQRLPTKGWADPFSGPSLDYAMPNPLP